MSGDETGQRVGAETDQDKNAERTAANELASVVLSQLEHAVDGVRRGLKVYETVHKLDEVIGTQYGDIE